MSKTIVNALKEVSKELPCKETICLQQVIYNYADGTVSDPVFRFIRRCTEGRLKAQRGQAAIPSLKIAADLINDMNKIALRFNSK